MTRNTFIKRPLNRFHAIAREWLIQWQFQSKNFSVDHFLQNSVQQNCCDDIKWLKTNYCIRYSLATINTEQIEFDPISVCFCRIDSHLHIVSKNLTIKAAHAMYAHDNNTLNPVTWTKQKKNRNAHCVLGSWRTEIGWPLHRRWKTILTAMCLISVKHCISWNLK